MKILPAAILAIGMISSAGAPASAQDTPPSIPAPTSIPDEAALELFLQFETLRDTDPQAALAIADSMLADADSPDLRLIFAETALEAGLPQKALDYLAPLPDRLASSDTMLTACHDLMAKAHAALGDDKAALMSQLAAYNTLEERLGPENPALASRLDSLQPQVAELLPELLPQLAEMRRIVEEAAKAEAGQLRAFGAPDAVTVWYGTNRLPTGNSDPAQFYGSDRGDLGVGTLTVTIPPNHLAGMIERPSVWNFTGHEDPEEHVVLAGLETMAKDAFSEGCCGSEDRLLFIHGYNVTFHDGALRAAQLGYDLEFPGKTMYYSWPSKASLYGYLSDANGVVSSRPAIEEFFELATRGDGKLHVIAHSMGNRYALEALESFFRAYPDRRLGQLVLAAPDVDRAEFLTRFPAIRDKADGVTLYASKHDLALAVSRRVNGAPRLGDANNGVVTIAGLDTVDASQVEADRLGHSYFGDAPQILGDIVGLIRLGWQPDERCSVTASASAEGELWEVEPTGCRVEAVRTAGDLIRLHGEDALTEAQRRYDSAPGDQLEFWLGVMDVVQNRLGG